MSAKPPPASGRQRPFQAISAVAAPRARQRKIDQASVTRAALAIVDEYGFGGLTMRRVADRLGVGLATLYNAAGSKDAILDDMIEMVFAELPTPESTSGREFTSLVELWTATHELLFANPSVAQLTALKPAGGPGLFTLIESTLGLLRRAGVDEHLIATAFDTIRSYTLGYTLLRISRTDPDAAVAEARLAETTSLASDQFPEIVALAPTMARPVTSEHFVLGLSHLLRGFLPTAN